MTTEARFERQLPAVLEDLYLGPSPDYRDEVLVAATRTRQRSAWTFPGRWLPMDITNRSIPVARLPWRQVGIVALLVALLVAALAAYVGSQRRVPAPFGPVRNGLIAYAADGDLFTADPTTGETHPVVTGPDVDRRPAFSRDGTHLAFLRMTGTTSSGAFALAVAGADGSDVRIVPGASLTEDDYFEWAPNGSYVMVAAADGTLTRYAAAGSAQPVKVADHVRFVPGSFRPPDGQEILVQPDDPTGFTLSVLNADGTGSRPIWHIAAADASTNDLQEFHWSPDGTRIAFVLGPSGDESQLRAFVMQADGSAVRPLTTTPGAWFETDLAWSPDGSKIAFNRWRQNATGGWEIQPIGIVSAGGGPVVAAGPTPVSDGASFDWSPDGESIVSIPATVMQWPASPMKSANPVLIDPIYGGSRALGWTVGSATTWQRLAP